MDGRLRYCLALDLKQNQDLIEQYIAHHKPENAWPQITQNMRELGILDMEIYRVDNRLFMIMETKIGFDPNKPPLTALGKQKSDEWEALMWKYQQPLKSAAPGEKWVKMDKIYDLKSALI
ncbi:L-rhamnose mutarotase [Shewanella sp. 10N.286.48.B5]|uniref:L-rhamnose mutarotase n=1 Tax=Shewanella sp. 10N.286.48.B5 TaxID=1880834 RepID=UPI000C816445|nr:L-rhamnose mutarotase [Shewanella sp. 10N.286.48.B5]PMH84277.1 L-fucose mutarotase [Shewanella sp. 10N.286.48.B5]